MTPEQQLRFERRARFYGGGQHERNAGPTAAEAVRMARRARDVDAAISAGSTLADDGARITVRPDGYTVITQPDPPHFRPDARSRAAAALELRRRQLALVALG